MTYPSDPNLDTSPNVGTRRGVRNEGFGWGIPLAIAAIVIVAGVLFYNWGGDRTNTASNNAPTTTQSAPAPTAPATTPAPAPTPSAPKGG
jgi:hypothetical protein